MKIFAVSDLHLSINNPKPMDIFGGAWDNYLPALVANWERKIGADDVVLIGGDISWAMSLEGALPDLNFIGALPGKKVLLRGNHDYWWSSVSRIRSVLPTGVYVIQNDAVRFGRAVIFGTRGWTIPEPGTVQNEEDAKILNRELERARLSVAAMQKIRQEGDITVFLTHFPPFNSRALPSPMTEIITASGAAYAVYGHLHGKTIKTLKNAGLEGVRYLIASIDQINNDPICVAQVI